MSWRARGGLLMYRFRKGELEVFLAHPGCPPRNESEPQEWVIPKGGQEPTETLLEAARREFEEEVGIEARGPFIDLGRVEQNNGKIVHAWAFQGEWDDLQPIRSHLIELEWPPNSGQVQKFPECDQGRFFSLAEARDQLRKSQRPFLDRLVAELGLGSKAAPQENPPPDHGDNDQRHHQA